MTKSCNYFCGAKHASNIILQNFKTPPLALFHNHLTETRDPLCITVKEQQEKLTLYKSII